MNKKRRIGGAVLACLCGFAAAAGFAVAGRTASGEAAFEPVSFDETYELGTVLSVPEAKVNVDGESHVAVPVVYYPDGTAYLKDEATLDQAGSYRVEYRFEAGGRLYTESYRFDVVKKLYSVSGGSASYGEDESFHETGAKGIRLTLSDGDVFTYAKVVDLGKFSPEESVISLFMLPQTPGAMDAQVIYVTFTDVYDPDNYVTVLCQGVEDTTAGWGYVTGYMMAAANGQVQIGIEGETVHKGNGYGKPVFFSFYGMSGYPVSQYQMSVAFDLDEKIVYGSDRGGRKIVDLDDLSYEKFAWEGFTTGEVYVSVSAGKFKATSVELMITDIAGDDLSEEYVYDTEGPRIEVDYNGFGTVPEGVVGYAYPLFDATATDPYSGSCPVTTRVFYNYQSSNRYEVDLSGGFVPTREGVYTIEYSAYDRYGNLGRELVPVRIVSSSEPLEITLEGGASAGRKGEAVELASACVSGGVGAGYEVTVQAILGDSVETVDGTYLPLSSGTCTILYTARDFVGQTVRTSYEIEIEDNHLPVFWTEPVLPAYFLEGFTYSLPEFFGYDCSDSFKELAAEVTVSDGGGERSAAGGYKPVTNEEKKAVVTYTIKNAFGSASLIREVPIVSAFSEDGALDIVGYFVPFGGASVTYNATSECMVLRMTQASDGGGFTFANPLLADGFSFRCNVNAGFKRFTKMSFLLTDYEDRSVSVKITFIRTEASTLVEVNGELLKQTLPENYLTSGSKLDFAYDNDSFVFSQGDVLNFVVGSCLGGAPFNGFPSEKFYLSVCFEGVTGDTRLRMYRLNGQIFSVDADTVQPAVRIFGEYEPQTELGAKVTIHAAAAADVLDPVARGSVSVVGPDGRYLTSDGVVLENADMSRAYVVTANAYGTYIVSYTVEDTSGNKKTYAYSFTVPDKTPPEFALKGDLKTSYKVNEKLVLPETEATDELGGVTVICSLTSPGGTRVTAKEGLVLDKAGTYVLTYFVMDSSGNFTVREYRLTVN